MQVKFYICVMPMLDKVMRAIYSAGISLYATAVKLASLNNAKAKKMIDGHKGLFDNLKGLVKPNDRYIWFHAASLGEFEQGRPIIEKIKSQKPEYKIILTFFSPSGYEVRKNYQGADIICYLPFDKVSNAKEFLDIVKPEMAFFVKYEFWVNYLLELNRRNSPAYLVSGIFREKQSFFKWYGSFFRSLLPLYKGLFIQDESSDILLKSIGVNSAVVTGDTRFDRVIDIMQASKELPIVERFVTDSPFTLVAGSSWPKDEDIIIEHFNNNPGVKLIIAPHETHEEHIKDIISKLKRPYVRYTQIKDPGEEINADCMIIDCIGLLSSVYRYGDVAYIGGGFGVGIHNTLEAAVYSMPVIWGPNYQRFKEARDLKSEEGGFAINGSLEYENIMKKLMSDAGYLDLSGQKAGDFVRGNAGATDKIWDSVFKKADT